MRRRAFIAGVAAVAALPLEVYAQQAQRRVAMLLAADSEIDKAARARIAAFRSELQHLGWIDEHKVRLELRWGDGNSDRGKALAEEVVRSKPVLHSERPSQCTNRRWLLGDRAGASLPSIAQ